MLRAIGRRCWGHRIVQKKWCGAFFLLIVLPLCSQSLRDQNKGYFNAIQWEALNDDLTTPPLPEPYTIEGSQPVPYADTIDDGAILPSLPQLGLLDYQNIPEDLLNFCDTIAASVVEKSISAALFSTQKAFLPYLGLFMIEHFPDFAYAFYGRPSFKQDGSATILMRFTVKKTVAEDSAIAEESATNEDAHLPHDTVGAEKPDLAVFPVKNTEGTEAINDINTATVTHEQIQEQPENTADVPNLFSETEQPLFIMLEFGAVEEGAAWKISYIDFKGAEYENSALQN